MHYPVFIAAVAFAGAAAAIDTAAAQCGDFSTDVCDGAQASATTDAPPAASRAQPAPPATVVRLTGADLAVQTHKWNGRTIQTAVNCLYADIDEFRCIARTGGGSARIDFARIEPPDARAAIEQNCDTIEKSLRRICNFKIQFVYDGYDESDRGGLFGKLTIVIARDLTARVVR